MLWLGTPLFAGLHFLVCKLHPHLRVAPLFAGCNPGLLFTRLDCSLHPWFAVYTPGLQLAPPGLWFAPSLVLHLLSMVAPLVCGTHAPFVGCTPCLKSAPPCAFRKPRVQTTRGCKPQTRRATHKQHVQPTNKACFPQTRPCKPTNKAMQPHKQGGASRKLWVHPANNLTPLVRGLHRLVCGLHSQVRGLNPLVCGLRLWAAPVGVFVCGLHTLCLWVAHTFFVGCTPLLVGCTPCLWLASPGLRVSPPGLWACTPWFAACTPWFVACTILFVVCTPFFLACTPFFCGLAPPLFVGCTHLVCGLFAG